MQIIEILAKHFPPSEFALLPEVRNGAGHNANRSADYMAMNLWPSRGLALHGIEQKSFRGDWIKELKTPAKAEAFFNYCDYWWLLTTTEGVAKIDEIPEKWGWMQITNGKIKIIKHAPKLTPINLDRGIIASMLKRAVCKDGYILNSSIRDKINDAKLEAESISSRKIARLEQTNTALMKQLNEFRSFTGIDIGQVDTWRQPNMEKIGQAVNTILNGGTDKIIKDLTNLKSSAERVLTAIDSSINGLKSLEND